VLPAVEVAVDNEVTILRGGLICFYLSSCVAQMPETHDGVLMMGSAKFGKNNTKKQVAP